MHSVRCCWGPCKVCVCTCCCRGVRDFGVALCALFLLAMHKWQVVIIFLSSSCVLDVGGFNLYAGFLRAAQMYVPVNVCLIHARFSAALVCSGHAQFAPSSSICCLRPVLSSFRVPDVDGFSRKLKQIVSRLFVMLSGQNRAAELQYL